MTEDEGRMRTYTVTGRVFFVSAERFVNAFDYKEGINHGVTYELVKKTVIPADPDDGLAILRTLVRKFC